MSFPQIIQKSYVVVGSRKHPLTYTILKNEVQIAEAIYTTFSSFASSDLSVGLIQNCHCLKIHCGVSTELCARRQESCAWLTAISRF